jgi:uncharacterized protein
MFGALLKMMTEQKHTQAPLPTKLRGKDTLVGWRIWEIGRGADGSPRLFAPKTGVEWIPGRPTWVRDGCALGHTKPSSHCGVYAVDAPASWMLHGERGNLFSPAFPLAIGHVRLWGEIFERRFRGYAGEYGSPVRAWIPEHPDLDLDRDPRELARLYKIPVERGIPPELEAMVTAGSTDEAGQGRSFDELLGEVRARSAIPPRSSHGPEHWNRVRELGLEIAGSTRGADLHSVELFALLHDAMRETEFVDPGHGDRGAELAIELALEGAIGLRESQFVKLLYACRRHTDGLTSKDPTIGACWDADRLDLIRDGELPRVELISTLAGRLRVDGMADQRIKAGS